MTLEQEQEQEQRRARMQADWTRFMTEEFARRAREQRFFDRLLPRRTMRTQCAPPNIIPRDFGIDWGGSEGDQTVLAFGGRVGPQFVEMGFTDLERRLAVAMGIPPEFMSGPLGEAYRVKECKMRKITIESALNGWIVHAGCQTLVYEDARDMLADLGTYLSDPMGVEKLVMTAKQDQEIPGLRMVVRRPPAALAMPVPDSSVSTRPCPEPNAASYVEQQERRR